MSLHEILQRVLELQPSWEWQNTPPMRERGQLVRTGGPDAVSSLLPAPGRRPTTDINVEGSDGTGRKNRVPWIRVYSRRHSPSATEGWYVVYLFSFSGDAVYLSLNRGTTEWTAGGPQPRPEEAIKERVTWARGLLGGRITHLDHSIALSDPGRLGTSYEHGNVCARAYHRGQIPSDDELAQDLVEFIGLLGSLYNPEQVEANGSGNEVGDERRALHLLLRWSATRERRTIELHREVESKRGAVWWGQFGRGIGHDRLERFRQQLGEGIPTHVYLFGGDSLWRTRLVVVPT